MVFGVPILFYFDTSFFFFFFDFQNVYHGHSWFWAYSLRTSFISEIFSLGHFSRIASVYPLTADNFIHQTASQFPFNRTNFLLLSDARPWTHIMAFTHTCKYEFIYIYIMDSYHIVRVKHCYFQFYFLVLVYLLLSERNAI